MRLGGYMWVLCNVCYREHKKKGHVGRAPSAPPTRDRGREVAIIIYLPRRHAVIIPCGSVNGWVAGGLKWVRVGSIVHFDVRQFFGGPAHSGYNESDFIRKIFISTTERSTRCEPKTTSRFYHDVIIQNTAPM